MKLNATARIRLVKASIAVKANPDEFVNLTDALTEMLGKPATRKPGFYTFCVDVAGRDFDIEVRDEGKKIQVHVDKNGKTKYSADCDDAMVALRAIEEGVKQYVRHEVKDAKAGKLLLQQFKRKPITL